jgi:hypothetical protein
MREDGRNLGKLLIDLHPFRVTRFGDDTKTTS